MQLTTQQQQVLARMAAFAGGAGRRIFLLKGYAGTGKTTLVGELVRRLETDGYTPVLLATTGRAAKVLQDKTGVEASTVHNRIYTFEGIESEGGQASEVDKDGQLVLNFPLKSRDEDIINPVYIIDEASMISHEPPAEGKTHTAKFGSGSLLDDLIKYAGNAKMVFVGDPCQLPPIGDNPFSSALSEKLLRERYGLQVETVELTDIVRQNRNSEILRLAAPFRNDVLRGNFVNYPKVQVPTGENAHLYRDDRELITAYLKTIQHADGFYKATMIGSSNAQCKRLNDFFRGSLYNKLEIQNGELLMVVQNSYVVRLVNGDQVLVEKVNYDSKRAGFTFLKARLRALHNGEVCETLLLRELLYNDQAGLRPEDAQKLIIDFDQRARAVGLKRNSDAYKNAMRVDPYLNALRAKFGYALTCHKAQGGEWPEVYLNINKSLYGWKGPLLYRWYYTALTRAQSNLHINDGWWIAQYDARNPKAYKRFIK